MTYREYTPPPSLKHTVECAWTSSSASVGLLQTVLPDGAMDVIASLYPDGDIADIWVVGAMTRPLLATSNGLGLVAIRFLPGAGGSALRTNAAALRDASVALDCVMPRSESLRALFRELARAPGDGVVLARLGEKLAIQRNAIPSVVRHAADIVAGGRESTSVQHVAKQVGVSRQQLARLFACHVGLTPKQFARVCRVRAMLSSTYDNDVNWSVLAHDWGFADQSHLIADVQRVVGRSPAEWLRGARGEPRMTRVRGATP